MKSGRRGTGTSAQLDREGDVGKGKAEPSLGWSAVSSRLVHMPPCSANLLPRFAPSILLNLHTRSSLEMATPTSLHAGSRMSQLPLR